MTRGSTIIWGNDELTRAPYAPDAKHIRRDTFQLGARSAPLTRSHSLGPRNESASLHASGASFERSQVAQALIDVGALIFAFLFIALVGLSITTAIIILLFVVSF